MTDVETGGIVAAPTTSLPEAFGGERNWDYRYCWLRDASLTLTAFLNVGYRHETLLWRNWLLRAVAGDPASMQIMYGVDGSRNLAERELPGLPGYANSRPVRIGNGAAQQQQRDVLGEVMIALHRARESGLPETEDSWALQCALVEHHAKIWDEPDQGLWEIRGPARQFTHSGAMSWAALDRAVKAIQHYGLPGPEQRWIEVRDDIRDRVLQRGVCDAGYFTQYEGTEEVDASLLLLAPIGFVASDDPRYLATMERIERDLMRDGLIWRYRTSTGVDGLRGEENPFLACSFWMVSAYALTGQTAKAQALMDRLLELRNDVGLMAEEYRADGQGFAGNYPQAFSHLALVGAAFTLAGGGSRAAVGRP